MKKKFLTWKWVIKTVHSREDTKINECDKFHNYGYFIDDNSKVWKYCFLPPKKDELTNVV